MSGHVYVFVYFSTCMRVCDVCEKSVGVSAAALGLVLRQRTVGSCDTGQGDEGGGYEKSDFDICCRSFLFDDAGIPQFTFLM